MENQNSALKIGKFVNFRPLDTPLEISQIPKFGRSTFERSLIFNFEPSAILKFNRLKFQPTSPIPNLLYKLLHRTIPLQNPWVPQYQKWQSSVRERKSNNWNKKFGFTVASVEAKPSQCLRKTEIFWSANPSVLLVNTFSPEWTMVPQNIFY